MSFGIRDIKRSGEGADARESIRERQVAGETLTIGRRAGSDILIETLSIQLDHAVFTRRDGTLSVALAQGATALIDGKVLSSATRALRLGSVVKIGPLSLTIEAHNETHSVVAVEKADVQVRRWSRADENAVFSPTAVLPSKRLLSWLGATFIGLFFLALPILAHQSPKHPIVEAIPVQLDASWNSGPLSLLHSNLQGDCAACHDGAFEAVKDETCLDCHTDLQNHAEPARLVSAAVPLTGVDAVLGDVSEAFGRPLDRCGSCHMEHNGTQHIIASSDALCADCHAGLDTRLVDTDIGNASDFGTDHPQFRPWIITEPDPINPTFMRVSLEDNPKGFSGLKFPHDVHMQSGGAVARMAGTLPTRFEFSDGVDCEDCHTPEAGGALYEPVRMEQDCAMCHSIAFEIEEDGYVRTLRHGEPEEVIASMQDFYDAKALANIRDTAMDTRTRRRPGSAARLRELNRRELAFARADALTLAKVQAIFSEGGSCYDCHVIIPPGAKDDPLDYTVGPISVSDSFYRRSVFNHAAHEIEGLECTDCHAATTSSTSDDILLPQIDVCRDCHIGEESWHAGGEATDGTFPSNCLTCHGYHDGLHSEGVMTDPALQSVSSGTGSSATASDAR